MEGAIAEEPESAGVRGDVAADMAGPLGAEVEREDVRVGGEEGVCGFEDHAGVRDEDAGGGVEGADGVEGGEGEDEFVEDGDRAADEAGVAALGDDGESAVVAVPEDGGDVAGGLGAEDEARLAAVLAHPVGVEGVEVAGRRAGVGGDDGADGLEVRDVGRGELGEAGVALDAGVAAGC